MRQNYSESAHKQKPLGRKKKVSITGVDHRVLYESWVKQGFVKVAVSRAVCLGEFPLVLQIA